MYGMVKIQFGVHRLCLLHKLAVNLVESIQGVLMAQGTNFAGDGTTVRHNVGGATAGNGAHIYRHIAPSPAGKIGNCGSSHLNGVHAVLRRKAGVGCLAHHLCGKSNQRRRCHSTVPYRAGQIHHIRRLGLQALRIKCLGTHAKMLLSGGKQQFQRRMGCAAL